MGYEQAKFGDGSAAGSGNVKSTVSQHYGAKTEDSPKGVVRTAGGYNELVIDFDTDKPLFMDVYIPAGAVVTDLDVSKATGAVSAATVGVIDISAADGLTATEVDITTTGKVAVTGPTAGKVVVLYKNYAG